MQKLQVYDLGPDEKHRTSSSLPSACHCATGQRATSSAAIATVTSPTTRTCSGDGSRSADCASHPGFLSFRTSNGYTSLFQEYAGLRLVTRTWCIDGESLPRSRRPSIRCLRHLPRTRGLLMTPFSLLQVRCQPSRSTVSIDTAP